jgi:hypothetical protein
MENSMKLFKSGGKRNFVDENNVLLGYDMEQNCCEKFDWFISKKPTAHLPEIRDRMKDFDLSEYEFDSNWIGKVSISEDCCQYDKIAIFRLLWSKDTWDETKFMYLHLFNSHNGYYSHGFKFSDGSEIIEEGSL